MRTRGFTLMEVLAAIVLIAIVLPVAMHGISLATTVGHIAQRKAEAATLAHSKLNELLITNAWQTNVMSGDFGEEHPDFKWTAQLQAWDTSSLKELDLRVIWIDRNREESVTLSTLVETESQ